MKYTIETASNGWLETLEVFGKSYKKRFVRTETFRYKCQHDDFAEQLKKDGVRDEEFLEKIEDLFDGIGAGSDMQRMTDYYGC